MPRTLTSEERQELQEALEKVQETQSDFWMALSDLETMLDGVDLDGNADFEGYTVDDLLQMEEDREPPDPPGWEGGFADNH